MERETYTIETPVSKQKITLKSYITGREKRELTNSYFGGSLEFDADSQNIKGFNPDSIDKAQNTAWRIVIVSIDDKKDGVDGFSVVETILDMRAEDYDFIVKEVNKITADSALEKKNQS